MDRIRRDRIINQYQQLVEQDTSSDEGQSSDANQQKLVQSLQKILNLFVSNKLLLQDDAKRIFGAVGKGMEKAKAKEGNGGGDKEPSEAEIQQFLKGYDNLSPELQKQIDQKLEKEDGISKAEIDKFLNTPI